ncbi:hypothetical protein RI129_006215 [Pyrocoelia pectoralis]|uniref:DDE Tnp4 domain-containing protein n=1 Tax=Pyrocoelia pectoralis TaxID=417401 RepID=A0AAN7ZG10_9COLE
MAICDANYNFLYCDVGVQGRIADGGVFASTDFCSALQNNKLNLPNARSLPGRQINVPFVIVADDAFALSGNVMKPFPGKHFKGSVERAYNYRHSRARRVIENAFGILSAVFRVLRKPMLLAPDKVTQVVLSCVYLHNFLRRNRKSRDIYSPPSAFDREDDNGNLIQGEWRRDNIELGSLRNCSTNNRNLDGITIRNEFAQYFHNQPLSWQHRCA